MDELFKDADESKPCPPSSDLVRLFKALMERNDDAPGTGDVQSLTLRQRFAGAAFRLLYTASMNMSVVHGPVFAPNCVS